ncbi:MAG: GNAT family N-acetyltransferase [Gammaproteobacteria bacterium]|nr:GNAT family N-acetyltransferase [Gammaproteobacteria bacterium]
MTVLVPMEQHEFEDFRRSSVNQFARSSIKAGLCDDDDALSFAENQFSRLLPNGIDTPGHYISNIVCPDNGDAVGVMWFAVEPQGRNGCAYVYDISVSEKHRRQGYAQQAFAEMESIVRTLGMNRIDLHVFAWNAGAIELYKKMGFEVTGMNMTRRLDKP